MPITHVTGNVIRVTKEPFSSSNNEQSSGTPIERTENHDSGKTILHLFEEQVNKTPDAIALVCDDTEITYKELNEQTNRLARFLQKRNIKTERCIAVCMDRSLNLVISILGILKAGGTYIPVDPEYPQKRIEHLIQDARASFVITDKKNKPRLSSVKNASLIEVDSEWKRIRKQSSKKVQVKINPGQLAYVIYTSGSTGKPKGVMIEHFSVYSFICWSRQEFALSPFDTVYAATSVCFDLSVFEIFYPLCAGKKIRILKSGLQIENYLQKDKNILLNTVPSMIDNLLKRKVDLAHVTAINMAGEPVPFTVLQNLDTDKIETRNLYGPTEDTVYSTVYRLKKDLPILIGKPISNTRIYILDSLQRPVPFGEEGEIFIAGHGLARGYLNQEQLTRERFLTDPFSDDPNEKMYKTGDLGRWQKDGNIQFLGRIDDQVKIKGFRIELGEIERVMEQSGLVQRAVVTGNEDNNGNKRLVAYVIPQKNFNRDGMNDYLKERLPYFMLPSFFVKMEEIPFTKNGKIDRKRLPQPEQGLPESNYQAPRNPTEEALTTIWQEALEINPIGIWDNFFDLGGDSLLSMQVVSKARYSNILLQPADLFNYPTIAQLSELIQEHPEKENKTTGSIVPFRKKGSHPPFFALPGFWIYRKLALYLNEERPFFGYEPYDHTNIKAIAADFIRKIKKEQPRGPYFLGGFCENYAIAFETAHQLLEQGEAMGLLVLIEAHAPYSALSKEGPRFIARKIKFYRQRMKALSLREKLKYVHKEIKYAALVLSLKLKQKKKPPLRTYPGDVALIRSSIVAPSYSKHPKMGWQPYVTGSIETITIEGDHTGILEEPAVEVLADKLHAMLIRYARLFTQTLFLVIGSGVNID
jgi:amino acid adenylation domain-containing protein